jgi:hypothetical protein
MCSAGDVFVAIAPDKAFIWKGSSSSEQEQASASSVIGYLMQGAGIRETVHVKEGDELEAFWTAIGGKGAGIWSLPQLLSTDAACTEASALKKPIMPMFVLPAATAFVRFHIMR